MPRLTLENGMTIGIGICSNDGKTVLLEPTFTFKPPYGMETSFEMFFKYPGKMADTPSAQHWKRTSLKLNEIKVPEGDYFYYRIAGLFLGYSTETESRQLSWTYSTINEVTIWGLFIDEDGEYIYLGQNNGEEWQTENNVPLWQLIDPEKDVALTGDDDPYGPGGESGPGGEGGTDPVPPGTFDDKSDPIPDSSLPTISAANTGFTRIYNPTLSEIQNFARYLWTDESLLKTLWNHLKQYFEDPMDAIIGFNLVPVRVPNAGTENVAILFIDTGVSMTVAANQFVDQDCGTCKLERYYGSALDQSPYTKVSCYLPYIGTVNLNTDEVMGTTLQVKYRVDIVTGSCVAKILVDGNVLYQYSGHCAINVPISSANFSTYVSAAISIAKLATGALIGGAGILAPTLTLDPSQETNKVTTLTTTRTNTERNPNTGRQVTVGTSTITQRYEEPIPVSTTMASYNGLSPANISNTVGQVMSSKPHVEHSGSFSGNSGYLGIRRPYLIIERPNMCLPAEYGKFNGYPSMITMNLSDCTGYTRIQQVQLTGMTATNPEQAEILSLLKSGVIF